jgi:hypothetical protein
VMTRVPRRRRLAAVTEPDRVIRALAAALDILTHGFDPSKDDSVRCAHTDEASGRPCGMREDDAEHMTPERVMHEYGYGLPGAEDVAHRDAR